MQGHAQEQNDAINMMGLPPMVGAPPATPYMNMPAQVQAFQPRLSPEMQQIQQMTPQLKGDKPVLQEVTLYPAGTYNKNLAQKFRQGKRDIKAGLAEGKAVGVDGFGGEEAAKTYGRFGVEAKDVSKTQNREGYTGGVTYGFKKSFVGRSGRAPAEEAFETENDIFSITAVALMGFLMGSGITLAVHRIRLASSKSYAKEAPLLLA